MTGVGSTTSSGALTFSTGTGKDLSGRTLNNAGTATWKDGGAITVHSGALLDNQSGATFLIQNDVTMNGANFFETAGSFTNEGTLNKQGTSGTTTIAVPFTNSGTVTVSSGTLSFTAAAYIQTGGSTVVAGGTTLAANQGLLLQGGTLSGTGTINANVTNSGQVNPGGDGTAGILTINGSYTQTDSGVLSIDLGGTTVGSQYDQLKVNGAVFLGGTLTVQLINGFTPKAGDSFQILLFSSRTGDFTTENFPDLGPGLVLSPVFSSSSLTLVTQATP
jgi:hypothetical protein